MIRTETAGVVVDVIVTDHKGHHVRGLKAEDFRVFEDGTPQTIASFTPALPGETAVHGAVPPAGGGARGTSPTQGRAPQLFTLLMDLGDIHQENLARACSAASAFAEKAAEAGDLVAVYWVDSTLHLATPFTGEPPLLHDVFDRMSRRTPSGRLTAREREQTENQLEDLFTQVYPQTLAGAPPAPLKSAFVTKGSGRPSIEEEIEIASEHAHLQEMNVLRSWLTITSSLQARAVLMALRALAESYRNVPGRKTVMVFSEGFLHSPSAGREMQGVVDAAQRANVAIYVIDATGVDAGMSADVETIDLDLQKRYTQDFSTLGAGQQASGLSQFDWMQTLGSDPDNDLGNLAVATGGFLARGVNDLGRTIDRVLDDAGEFYVLMYYPSNRNYDGSFRRIRVELATSGEHLRYRQGYWALPAGRAIMMTPAGAQLLASVQSGSLKPAFTPALNMALEPTPDGRYGIAAAVSMPASLVPLQRIKSEYVTDVNTLLVARDEHGELLGVQERYGHLRLTRADRERFKAGIFTLQGHVGVPSLQPVRVQAIVQFTNGLMGTSAAAELRPAPPAASLQLSNLVLADKEENAECTSDPLDPLCLTDLRIVLPARPEFSAVNRLIAFCGVIGLKLDSRQKPALRLGFTLEQGNAADPIKPLQVLVTRGYGMGNLLALAVLDLKGRPPGNYRLRVVAEDERQHAQTSESATLDLH